jgi:hypothetical protein
VISSWAGAIKTLPVGFTEKTGRIMSKPLAYWEGLLATARSNRQLFGEVLDRYDGVQFEPPPSKWLKRGGGGDRWVHNPNAHLSRPSYEVRLRHWRDATKIVAALDRQIAYYEERIAAHPIKTAWGHVLAGIKQAEREEDESRATRRAG